MGLEEDVTSRDGLLASLRDVTEKQFMLVRNLVGPVEAALGQAGLEVIDRGFRQFGEWRAENLRIAPSAIAGNQNARALLQNWDSGDLVLGTLDASTEIVGGPLKASVTMPSMLGSEQFTGLGKADLLRRYWAETMSGMAAGFSEGCTIRSDAPDIFGPWTITVDFLASHAKGRVRSDIGIDTEILSDPERALPLIRRSSRNAGALYMFVAREVIRAYDAAGEQLVREGVRGFGRERGLALREKHLREGRELNMKTLMLDWDGPLVSTWVFKDEGYLSEGTWHQDCVYCPYADVWSQFGNEGLDLGYLYDVELHTTLYQTYHPQTLVRWESLKTRGDHVCRFRFSIPDLVGPEDPQFSMKKRAAGD
ncbi:L-2-amino-thiazoline-4-carboxylic acid hydrolase [Bradyrhizobium sp. B124]|uniref:L-2-amino-thiazoline-4-carboxylic acid hydrolase n=1 Tax=Bradyrhizobium sp. B124 TaxID=3140245 RepID=UPI003182FB85